MTDPAHALPTPSSACARREPGHHDAVRFFCVELADDNVADPGQYAHADQLADALSNTQHHAHRHSDAHALGDTNVIGHLGPHLKLLGVALAVSF